MDGERALDTGETTAKTFYFATQLDLYLSFPQIPNSAFVSTFSHPAAIFTMEVRTWSRGEDHVQQHSIPIQFNPV